MGAIAGPLVGLFLLGIFFPSANKNGAFIAVITTVSLFLFCSIGQNINHTYADYAMPTNFTCERNETFFDSFTGQNVSHSYKSAPKDYDPHYGKPGVFFLFRLSAFSYGPLGIIMVVFLGFVFSLLIPQKMTPYQQKLAYSLTYFGRNTFVEEQLSKREREMLLLHQKEDLYVTSM
jgi:hypothetical protein